MASSRSISNGTVRYYTVRFHPPVPAHNERSPRRSKSGGEKRRRRRKKWKRAAAYRMQTERRGSGGDESDIVVGPFESVLVAKPQTLYPIPRNQIEPGDFGVARVWPDEAVTCVGKVRLKKLS